MSAPDWLSALNRRFHLTKRARPRPRRGDRRLWVAAEVSTLEERCLMLGPRDAAGSRGFARSLRHRGKPQRRGLPISWIWPTAVGRAAVTCLVCKLARVGPGTPMGNLMREYWIPACLSSELKADGEPMRLLLLGEQLIAFRDGIRDAIGRQERTRKDYFELAVNECQQLESW